MAELETDDEIHRAKLRFLGTGEWTLPVHLTYGQWGLGAAITLPLTLVALLLFGPYSIGLAIMTGIILTALIARHVNHDRPARMVIRTALTDWRRRKPPTDPDGITTPVQFSTRHLTSGEPR